MGQLHLLGIDLGTTAIKAALFDASGRRVAASTREYPLLTPAPQGVDFQSADGELSKLFFLLLAPPDQSGPHIQALAEIARLAKSATFLRLLAGASSGKEVAELIREG